MNCLLRHVKLTEQTPVENFIDVQDRFFILVLITGNGIPGNTVNIFERSVAFPFHHAAVADELDFFMATWVFLIINFR